MIPSPREAHPRTIRPYPTAWARTGYFKTSSNSHYRKTSLSSQMTQIKMMECKIFIAKRTWGKEFTTRTLAQGSLLLCWASHHMAASQTFQQTSRSKTPAIQIMLLINQTLAETSKSWTMTWWRMENWSGANNRWVAPLIKKKFRFWIGWSRCRNKRPKLWQLRIKAISEHHDIW